MLNVVSTRLLTAELFMLVLGGRYVKKKNLTQAPPRVNPKLACLGRGLSGIICSAKARVHLPNVFRYVISAKWLELIARQCWEVARHGCCARPRNTPLSLPLSVSLSLSLL